MTEENAMPFDEEVDLTGAEIGFPVFPAGIVRARITSINVKENKTGGNNIVIQFKSEQALTTIEGNERPLGMPFSMYIPMQASLKKPDWDWQGNKKSRLSEIKLAAIGIKGGKFNSEEVIGKEVLIRLSLGKNEETGDPSNSVSRVSQLGGAQ